jgi:hypothetical protein
MGQAMRPPAPMRLRLWLATGAAVALTACGSDVTHVQGTGFPGQYSAGGSTSGEVLARAKEGAQGAGSPEGTPGIPQGSGGTTGGPNMGGTTGQQTAARQLGQAPVGDASKPLEAKPDSARTGGAKPREAKADDAKAGEAKAADARQAGNAEAEKQKQLLAAAMDRVAGRWQARKAAGGDAVQPESADVSRVGASQDPPRSEKHGTAPPSQDVKQPQEQSPEKAGSSLPSDAYKSGQ